jgi:hypothetical protein
MCDGFEIDTRVLALLLFSYAGEHEPGGKEAVLCLSMPKHFVTSPYLQC